MRFTHAEAMTDSSFYAPLAQAAEAAGYASITVADSIATRSNPTAPTYTPDGSRTFLEDKDFIETFIAAMGAVTKTLRFTTFVLKLPVRPPVLVAKQAASVAALTNNRVALGVGISPWREDFQIMGVPFENRGARMNECMDIVRGLTAGGYFEFHGKFYDIPAIKISPTPPNRSPCEGKPWDVHVISLDAYSLDGIKRLEDRGVTDVIVGFRIPYIVGPDTEPVSRKIDNLNRYADSIITKANP